MRTVFAAANILCVLGALAPSAAFAEMVVHSVTCELRYVNRANASAPRCLSCHDGTVGPAIPTGHGSHPVEVSYAAASARGDFRSIEEIARRNLVLVNGNVTCTSCHDWRSSLFARTATPELCTGCHER